MLATLEKAVTGSKWYSLIDTLYPSPAGSGVRCGKGQRRRGGVDSVSVEVNAANVETNLARLRDGLRTGGYRPQAIRRHDIPKPGSQGKRPSGYRSPGLDPGVQDRVCRRQSGMLLEPTRPLPSPAARPLPGAINDALALHG
jgi:RNA-directed DNA polymerase